MTALREHPKHLIPENFALDTVLSEAGALGAAFPAIACRTEWIGDQDIFYREAGPKDAPVVLLPLGFPADSRLFRSLIPALAGKFRLVAPDCPGFGKSSLPLADEFECTLENMTEMIAQFTEHLGLTRFSLYVQDQGTPISYRLALKYPERVEALIVHKGSCYARTPRLKRTGYKVLPLIAKREAKKNPDADKRAPC